MKLHCIEYLWKPKASPCVSIMQKL